MNVVYGLCWDGKDLFIGDPINAQSLSGRAFSVGLPLPLRVDTSGESYKAYAIMLQKGRGPSTTRRNDVEKIYGAIEDPTFYKFVVLRGQVFKAALIRDYEKIKLMNPEEYESYLEKLSRRTNPAVAKQLNLKVQK